MFGKLTRFDLTSTIRVNFGRSGFICHRKYLEMYTNDLPAAALAYVDKHMNGEDLLFNYMVANATGMGPIGTCARNRPRSGASRADSVFPPRLHNVVIEAWAAPISDQNNAGLWSRPGHMAARTEALRLYNRLFGRNPLRYTTS